MQDWVCFLRTIEISRSRSCAGTTGANPKPGLGKDISGLGSKCDSKLRSVTGKEVCIGAGTK